jgi:hypothetical protein
MATAVFRDRFRSEDVFLSLDRRDLDILRWFYLFVSGTDDQRAFDAADSGEEEACAASRHLPPATASRYLVKTQASCWSRDSSVAANR